MASISDTDILRSAVVKKIGTVIDTSVSLVGNKLEVLKEETQSLYSRLLGNKDEFISVDLLVREEDCDETIRNAWKSWANEIYSIDAEVHLTNPNCFHSKFIPADNGGDSEPYYYYASIREFWIPPKNAVIYFYK